MSIVYSALQKVGYPVFKPKVTDVRGAEHLPRKGGYVIAANHVDWLDGFYIATAIGLAAKNIPVYFLTKTNNYAWTTVTVQIPADRRGSVIDAAVRYLREGKVICNFIEGQRNTSRLLLPGKTGTVRMAIAAGVPVVPVGIEVTPGKTMANSLMNLFSKNHDVKIRIGRPIEFPNTPIENLSSDDLRGYTSRIMQHLAPLAGKRY